MTTTVQIEPDIRPLELPELVTAHRISSEVFDLPYSYETLRAYYEKAHGGFLGAVLGGGLAGFVVATSPRVVLFGRRVGEVAVLAVARQHQRQGIGSALLTAGMDLLRARGMRVVRLHVDTTNDGAIAMYERFGFARERIVPAYYRNGRDAYRMTKPLGGAAGRRGGVARSRLE